MLCKDTLCKILCRSLHDLNDLACSEEAEGVLAISCKSGYFIWTRLYAGYMVTFKTDVLFERTFNISLENYTDNSPLLRVWEMGAKRGTNNFVFNRSLTPPDKVYILFQNLFKEVTGLDPYLFS